MNDEHMPAVPPPTTQLLPHGTPTGLCDHHGVPIKVGDLLKKPVECNADFHGMHSFYRVALQGITPVLTYVRSAKGRVLPEGYMAMPLADEYDRKMFVFALDSTTLRPDSELEVVSEDGEPVLTHASAHEAAA